jgi:hypothetical protein
MLEHKGGGMSPGPESNKPPRHEQKKHRCNYGSFSQKDGSSIEGEIYSIDGADYLLAKKNKESIIYKVGKELSQVTDPNISKKIVEMVCENEEISKARAAHAKELSNGDRFLEKILFWNMDYIDGPVSEPVIREGISFYKVGHNATYNFYAGTKDGKKYAFTEGEGDYDEESGKLETEESFKQVEDWNYMGHY